MAFLGSNDEPDVFISYAHIDNLPDREGEKGWVEDFESQLSVRLLKRFGEPVAVWRDPELSRAQLFDEVIEKAVRGSGVLISLITPRYLKSDYCRQEIDWFREKAAAEPAGLTVDDHLRVFPVLLYNLPFSDWPEVCRGTSGFEFYDAEGDDVGEPMDPRGERFHKQLQQLVKELQTVLTGLKSATEDPEKAAAEADLEVEAGLEAAVEAEPAFSVFLSHPADDLGPTRRQLEAGLGKEGIRVVTGLPPPYPSAEHSAAVSEAIGEVDLSIHLLGALPGEPVDDRPESTYPVEQARLGLEHARSQLVLLPDPLGREQLRENADYHRFVTEELVEHERQAQRMELMRVGVHQMLDEILAKRARIEEAAKRREARSAEAAETAFIDLHARDVACAADLVGYLSKKHITPIMVPAGDLSPMAGMDWFEENLKKAQLFVVVFGKVARNWVNYRLQEAFKLIVTHQLKTQIGVYVAPPEKPHDQVSFPGHVADNMERFDPQTLEPMLAQWHRHE